MKKFFYVFIAFVTVFLVLGGNTVQSQTPVAKWGFLGNKGATATGGWKMKLSATAGSVGVAGDSNMTKTWCAIRGEFPTPMTATETQAIIVTGTLEFKGSDLNIWCPIRYGMFRHDSSGVLADSAGVLTGRSTGDTYWTGKETDTYGYMFAPNSGAYDISAWSNGLGTQGVINGGTARSTYNTSPIALGVVRQKPIGAIMTQGKYNFAISVRPVGTTRELRWYLVKQGTPAAYWFGGTVIDTNQTKVTSTFNDFSIALDGEHTYDITPQAPIRGMYLTDVNVSLGAPITVPEAPWAAVYLSKWGFLGNKGATATGGWKIKPDPDDIVGNVGVAGDSNMTKTWCAIRGEFPEPVTATESKAIIVTGTLEFKGSDLNIWCPIRYGIFRHDSSGVLADSAGVMTKRHPADAYWTGLETYTYGYMFAPNSGAYDISAWSNGLGTQGVINGGTARSTYNTSPIALGVVRQKPIGAIMTQGKYNFAFSVRPVGTARELRWYLVKQGTPAAYWFGGTIMDTNQTKVTSTFNDFSIALDGEHTYDITPQAPIRGMYLTDVKLDMGAPITVPEAPWAAVYLSKWGFLGNKGATATGGWKIKPDPDDIVGNVGVAGDSNMTKTWCAIRGEFPEPVTATESKAIIVTGTLEFKGSDLNIWCPIRYGIFRHDSSGVLADSAGVMTKRHPADAYWTGLETYTYGYMFAPNSGAYDISAWSNGLGTHGVINGGTARSTYNTSPIALGVVRQKPIGAIMTQGKYNFAFSVRPVGTTRELRWYLVKQGTPAAYWFGGTIMDTNQTKVTSTFNDFSIALDGEHTYDITPQAPIRGMYLTDVKLDMGAPITVPEAPWAAVYLSKWGFLGNKGATATGGWKIKPDPDDIVGNVGVAGDSNMTKTWCAIRGEFPEPVTATESKAIIVTGTLEFKGSDLNIWCPIRYGIFRHDSSGVLADSAGVMTKRHPADAYWTGLETYTYGYMFAPNSGAYDISAWSNGLGTHGVINGGTARSTYNTSPIALGVVRQKPVGAIMTQGKYNFAFSVRPVGTTRELRWYLVKQGTPVTYWFAGSIIDTNQTKVTSTFNDFSIALDGEHTYDITPQAPIRGMYLTDVKLDMGAPIKVPIAPWAAYYVSSWGIFGNQFNGWKFTPDPDAIAGNAGMSGTAANKDWTAMRGSFDPFDLADGAGLLIDGKVELVGGGFDAKSSLRVGVFYTETAGSLVDSLNTMTKRHADSTRWNGNDNGKGYLFIPQSGTNAQETWADSKAGNWGAVASGSWLQPNGTGDIMLGAIPQMPSKAVGGAGVYNFALSVVPKTGGNNDVKFTLFKSGYTYVATASVPSPLTTKFNSIAFALNTNASTTALKVTDVRIDTTIKGISVGVKATDGVSIPSVFAISQNYPNPFNPSTTIQYDVPVSSYVMLAVYDMLGREVAKLVNQTQGASKYTVQWDASNLSSGVYFYRIDARSQDGSKSFNAVKKLILMK